MKKNFSPLFGAFTLLMVMVTMSCTKSENVQPVPNHQPDSGHTIQPITTDTIKIEDDHWEKTSTGYHSDLRPFVNGRDIINVFVSYKGRDAQVSPGATVEFYGGHLENEGWQLTFYAIYDEIPFHTLSITLIVIQ